MNKRDFLKGLGALGLSFITPKVFAQSSDYLIKQLDKTNDKPIMLFVFLRGGHDGLSFLSPYSDSVYYEKRPHIALPKEKGLIISNEFSINPLLKESFYDLFNRKQAIFIPSSGQHHNSRSHFLSEDFISYGVNQATNESGFLNRLIEVTQLNGVSFTPSVRPIFKGKKSIPCFSLDEINFNTSSQEDKVIQQNYSQDSLLADALNNLNNNRNALMDIKKSNQQDYNQDSQFQRFARFMKLSNSNIGFIELAQWDTHISNHPLDSDLSELLEKLNSSLVSYKNSCTPADWKRTFIVLFSEFGRTVKENAGLGTEHGHGNLLTILGGGLNQGKILGDWTPLNKLHEDRDLFVHNEFNNVLAKLFKQAYGLNNQELNYILPNSSPEKFDLI